MRIIGLIYTGLAIFIALQAEAYFDQNAYNIHLLLDLSEEQTDQLRSFAPLVAIAPLALIALTSLLTRRVIWAAVMALCAGLVWMASTSAIGILYP
ncbi:hypothetical protein IV417_08855 [Alphaproteobacteria bacterium KMM 3653]|uniref:Uncharacterized protein n=1 Tax=Harenicola maris TaxID=2841044 RepID=A0AAP2CPN9_9RHOB|nr:hypothetical protein [Harenicola maris]